MSKSLMIPKLLNFFSTKSIKEKIIKNQLSEGQQFLYLFFIIIYDTFSSTQEWFAIAGKIPSSSDIINVWINLLITVLGLIVLFTANGGVKGRNFLSKYFAFSFTVGFKYAIIFLVASNIPLLTHMVNVGIYNVIVALFLNTLMITNIAFRLYETR